MKDQENNPDTGGKTILLQFVDSQERKLMKEMF